MSLTQFEDGRYHLRPGSEVSFPPLPPRVWFLSWYEPKERRKGKPNKSVRAWVRGYRCSDFVTTSITMCARVVAATSTAAWQAVDVAFPGVQESARVFCEQRPDDWWPRDAGVRP